jgi:hypothetical protein
MRRKRDEEMGADAVARANSPTAFPPNNNRQCSGGGGGGGEAGLEVYVSCRKC